MTSSEQQLDRVFQALSDSTRRNILLQIREQDLTVNDIASQFEISLPAVSKHLKVLEQAGLISRQKQGRKRLCHAEPELLAEPLAWLEYYQSFWSERLDNLKELLEHQTTSKQKE